MPGKWAFLLGLLDTAAFYGTIEFGFKITARNGSLRGSAPTLFRRVPKIAEEEIGLHAVIETGGKQYRVKEGQRLKIEKLDARVGEKVNPRVLMVAGDGEVRVGTPELEDAKVDLKVLRHGRGKKIIVFKYKPKKNYRRKKGHRQPFTEVLVEKISF